MAELQTTLEGFRKTQDDRAKTQMDLQGQLANLTAAIAKVHDYVWSKSGVGRIFIITL